MTAQVAGEGVLEVSLGAGLAAGGVHDLHLRLRGPLRLAHVGFSG